MQLPPPPPAAASRLPPRFVPTLTEVVQLPPDPGPASSPASGPVLDAGALHRPAVLSAEVQEQIIHRVMQRVDATLSQRLREALAELVLTHTQLIEPLLRLEIEEVVRGSVSDAIAQELRER